MEGITTPYHDLGDRCRPAWCRGADTHGAHLPLEVPAPFVPGRQWRPWSFRSTGTNRQPHISRSACHRHRTREVGPLLERTRPRAQPRTPDAPRKYVRTTTRSPASCNGGAS
jgi:hypothetical protein